MIKKFFYIIALILISCNSNKVPRGILSQEKMQEVYWDLIVADNLSREIVKKDTNKDLKSENIKYINQVLAIHKISKSDLDKSLNFYQKHPDLLSAMMDSLQKKESSKVLHPWDSVKIKTNQNRYGK